MKSLSIFRLSTCQILSGVNPLMTIIFSIFFLKEKFHAIYGIGIIVCFTGSVMIILNERKLEVTSDDLDDTSAKNIFAGILSLTINVNLNNFLYFLKSKKNLSFSLSKIKFLDERLYKDQI
jgi:drug/metabolite transporter (DMT)-like permease